MSTAVAYDVIARDNASKTFLKVAASAKEQEAAVKAAFNSNKQVAARARSTMTASLRAQEAEMNKAAAAAQKYGAATAKINANRAGLNALAGGMAKFGAAAALAFGVAVKQSLEFNDAMAKVGAFSEDAREHMGELKKVALTAGTSIGFSATQSANAMEEMVKAGLSTKDMINGGLKGSLELAAAGQIDVSQATSIAATALSQFQLQGKDLPHVADLLAAGADKALGGVEDLGEALNYGGLAAHQYGESLEQTTGTLAAFAQNGLLGSTAGTTFSQMLAKLAGPSAKAAGLMKEIGLNVYDANGDFVDMATLAGRLKTSFGKLTPAQRNAYETTIFGQRAIRGANVLIKEGSAGIADWTKKVNDQGFAAQTAARKMDSLKGDLTKLKAAFQTAFIGAGDSSQTPLRGMVQAITKVADAWNSLSDEAKGNITKIVGAMGLIGLGGAATIKVILGVAKIRKEFTDLGLPTGPISAIKKIRDALKALQASSVAMSGLGLAAGPVAVALGLGVAALVKWKQHQDAVNQSATDFDSVLDEMTGKIDANTAALNKNVQQKTIAELNDKGAYRAAADLGIKYNDVTQAALGNVAAQKRVADATGAAVGKQREGSLSAAGYASANKDSSAAVGANASAARKLNEALGTTREGMAKSIQKHNDATKATKEATEATKTSSKFHEFATESYKKTADAVKKEQQALEEERDAMIKSGNAAIGASNDHIAFKNAVADAQAALKKNGATLDENTKKGRDNRTALNNVASSTLAYVNDLIKNKASIDKQTSAMKQGRNEFIKTAPRWG